MRKWFEYIDNKDRQTILKLVDTQFLCLVSLHKSYHMCSSEHKRLVNRRLSSPW